MTGGWKNQRGGALIVVMMVGMVIAIGFAGFITSSVLVEANAVEASLARSRAYWAEMGNYNYALSRISKSKLCNSCLISLGGNRDTDLATVLQRYFSELNNYKVWTYPDESSSYTITTTNTATADDTSGRNSYSGWIMATSTVSSSSLVSGLDSHLPLMELRICVGLFSSGSRCGNLNASNGGIATAYFSINRLTNLSN
jgi:hypothetical protein